MDFLDSDSVSKEELIRVILESQKKVANLTNQMNEKEKTLQQITKELHDTQKKLNDVVVSDVSENLSSNVKDNEILNDHHVDLKCENDDNVKLDKLFVDDKAQRIAPRKRGRPKKRDSDYTSRSNTKGVKKLHKHKSPRLGEVTENDIDILSMTAIEEESYNIALKVETDDFDSITVYSENNSNIKEYVVTVVGPTPVCHICDVIFESVSKLAEHYANEHKHGISVNEDETKITVCKSHLRAHQRGIMRVPPRRRETGKRRVRKGPFICRFCDKRCSGKDYLDLHEFKHTKQKKYTCETCGRQFTMAPQLRAHMETKHEGLRYLCEICGKNFTVFANVQRHVIEVHGKQRPYSCYVCKKSFSQKISLKVHERTERHRRMLIRGYDF